MAEWKCLIAEWLVEYGNLHDGDIRSFAVEHENNHEVASALFTLFSTEEESSSTSSEQNDQVFKKSLASWVKKKYKSCYILDFTSHKYILSLLSFHKIIVNENILIACKSSINKDNNRLLAYIMNQIKYPNKILIVYLLKVPFNNILKMPQLI